MNVGLDEKLLRDTLGALEMFGVFLGVRLGLYVALHEGGPQTSGEMAERAGISPRYGMEWLEQQAVAGVLEVDHPELPAEDRRYSLPAEHVGVLVDPDDAAHLAPFAEMLVGIGQALDDVVLAYRSGRGVPYPRYGAHFRRGQGAINRPAFRADLVTSWVPAVPGLHDRLRQARARVADVGCGVGWATQAVAAAYPTAQVIGYDADEGSVQEARRLAADQGVDSERVRFRIGDATDVGDAGPFDLILILEALHDMARPVEALAAARRALAPQGVLLVADEKVAPTFTAPGDEIERVMYGWSITHCLPASLAEQPSAAIGTVLREGVLRELAAQARFSGVETLDVDAGFFRLYALSA